MLPMRSYIVPMRTIILILFKFVKRVGVIFNKLNLILPSFKGERSVLGK